MASIFTKIVNGEIPCHKIAENDKFLAFLDIMPLATGHTLVIPKKEVDYIFDVNDEDYMELWSFAKYVAKAVGQAIPCKRVGIAVIGLEVPHAHIHLVPLNKVSDINFERPKLNPSQEELLDAATKIKAKLA
jgi:histidine triad (HIT) family protein